MVKKYLKRNYNNSCIFIFLFETDIKMNLNYDK